jgi:hypothetical protein
MTIDLSQFVDKEVTVTLRNGSQCKVYIKEEFTSNGRNYYASGEYLDDEFTFFGHYSKNGVNGPETDTSPYDIIKIEHHYTKPMTESLKCETLKGITKSLIPELIPFVESHEKYAEVMGQLFHEFLTDKFGDMKPEVKCEISCMFMDSVTLV